MKQGARKTQDEGAVLLTTLLLLTIMAVVTVAIMDDIRFSILRAGNIQSAEQLDWYMRGSEQYAQIWLENIDPEELSQLITSEQAAILPFEEGQIIITAHDGRNCYNVNQLASEVSGVQARREFFALLQMMDIGAIEAETIAARVTDWVDADTAPTRGGGEGLSYANKNPPYTPANTDMTDLSEFRAIDGIDETLFLRLKPLLCANENQERNKLNVNTLMLDQAPLLASILGSKEGLKAAQAVILERPLGGYASINQVWALDSIRALKLRGAGRNKVSIGTDRIALDIQVQFDEQVRGLRSTFILGNRGGAELVSRRSVY